MPRSSAARVRRRSFDYTDSFWASNDKVSYYYYTYGGLGSGVPIALNKMIFV